jgi:hypothetical protein
MSMAWWWTPVTLAVERLRQEALEFKASLSCMALAVQTGFELKSKWL